MARNSFNMLLSATLVASALVSVGINQPALAKSKKHVATGRGAYFVPPPPPYAPSILPENMQHGRSVEKAEEMAEVAEKPPENPYKKYIFTRDAGDMPRVIKFGKTQNRNVITYLHNKT
ncbi:MAG TPA: hypothetical protein V6C89_06200 [Drouetiella sp.]|jgi:hypothetical protein